MTTWQIILFGIAFALFIVYDITVNKRCERIEKLEDVTKKWDRAKSALK